MKIGLLRNARVFLFSFLLLNTATARTELFDQRVFFGDDATATVAFSDTDSLVRLASLNVSSFDNDGGDGDPSCAASSGAGDCVSGACTSCGSSCCDGGCCRSRFWFAGVEATFLAPSLSDNRAQFATIDPFAGTTSIANRAAASVDDNLYAAPRLWLGLMGPCWGIVGRYWELNASEIYFDPLSSGGGFISQDRLDVYTLDLELIRRFYHGCSVWNLGFGVRHAGYDHDSTLITGALLGAQAPTDPFLSNAALASSQFNGTGPTLGLGGYRPLRSGCYSCLNLFWNLRGSVLWGNVSSSAEGRVDFAGPFGSVSLSELSTASSEDELFIGEVQVGLRWDHQLRCLPMRAFFQVAAEYQGWEANSTASTFEGVFAVPNAGTGISAISASDVRMDLYGFAIGTGCTW
jgi:hypothetical protein